MEGTAQRSWQCAFRFTGAVVSLPVAIVLTSLGAGVVLGRRLFALIASLLPALPAESPPPGHDASRVRERAFAAMKAARASGLLARPKP